MPIANEKRMAEIQLEALRRQLNPHFTFNAINSLQYFILNNETELALDYLYKLSGLIRQTLDQSGKLYVSLAEEMEYLKLYMAVENTRVESKVKYSITVGDNIDVESTRIPSMLIHPFVENSFLHSFPIDHPNPKIELIFELLDTGFLNCTIKDNGVGFDLTCISTGIELVKERLKITSPNHPHPLVIKSNAHEGTLVNLYIDKIIRSS